MSGFSEVLANSWFKYGAVPCIATGVALLIKFNSRPDAKHSELEDWAVGFDLCQVSFFAMLSDGVVEAIQLTAKTATTDAAKDRLAALPWLLFVMLIILLLVSFIVRKSGWKNISGTPAPPELNAWGLIFPLLIGVFYIIGAIMWMGA
jgi:hypothetical protein